ncbi:MAG: hypothetical protein JWO81_3083, partial [Alphaproteobacteria bacterium]|nr:hypothetical protein [Alphaproteobacteria bacterium]
MILGGPLLSLLAWVSTPLFSLSLEGEGGVSVSGAGEYSRTPSPLTPTLSPPGNGSLILASQDTAPPPPPAAQSGTNAEDAVLPGRRRPGVPQHELEPPVSQDNPGAVRAPPPEAFPTDQIPIPDRWRLIQTLGLVKEHWFDPYHQ